MTQIEQALNREHTLLDTLFSFNGKPMRSRFEWRIKIGPSSWVSGLPYLYTGFIERAFVFGSRAQASEFARKLGKRYRLIKTERYHG